jgi:hypothetical protein
MSFSNNVYVCGKCGYPAQNSTGIFRNKESPYNESLVCFRCKTDTPPVILEKDFLDAICQYSGCTVIRKNHYTSPQLSEKRMGMAHEFVP